MNVHQERNREGTGPDCPYMLKDERMGKTTSTAGQGAFEGTLGKNEGQATLCKKRQASQDVFKDVIRSFREKT